MKIKDKIKSYSFWVSLASAIILILKILGNRFGFSVDETMISDLFTALCSILVLLGIIVPPQNTTNSTASNDISHSKNSKLTLGNSNNNFESNESIKINEQQTSNLETITCDKSDEMNFIEEERNLQVENINQVIKETIESDEIFRESEDTNQSLENVNTPEEQTTENVDLKEMFLNIKEKFSGNLDSYIFELQEEIRKTREGM